MRQDRKNIDILREEARMPTLQNSLFAMRLEWLGHIIRMDRRSLVAVCGEQNVKENELMGDPDGCTKTRRLKTLREAV